jgi:hypothetical protein
MAGKNQQRLCISTPKPQAPRPKPRECYIRVIVSLRLRTPRSIVWLTLCGFLASAGLPLYESHGLGAADDAACLTTVGQTGSDTTVSALESNDQPAHCAVCHLLRAVNGSITPSVVTLTVPAPLSGNVGRHVDPTIAAQYSVRASRAPPLQA